MWFLISLMMLNSFSSIYLSSVYLLCLKVCPNHLPIFKWVFHLLLLTCKSFLYIIDTSPLLDVCFTKYFI